MHLRDHAEDLAKESVGNWKSFGSYSWHDRDERPDPDQWAVFNVRTRDASLLEQSNHAAMTRALAPFMGGDDPDVRESHAGHWAVGWVDGFEIRVYRDGEITPAFLAWTEIQLALANYPVLDDTDFAEREHDACLTWISQQGRSHVSKRAPKSWPSRVFGWLWDNEQSECESTDDSGAAPSEASILRALAALGYLSRDGRAAYRAAA